MINYAHRTKGRNGRAPGQTLQSSPQSPIESPAPPVFTIYAHTLTNAASIAHAVSKRFTHRSRKLGGRKRFVVSHSSKVASPWRRKQSSILSPSSKKNRCGDRKEEGIAVDAVKTRLQLMGVDYDEEETTSLMCKLEHMSQADATTTFSPPTTPLSLYSTTPKSISPLCLPFCPMDSSPRPLNFRSTTTSLQLPQTPVDTPSVETTYYSPQSTNSSTSSFDDPFALALELEPEPVQVKSPYFESLIFAASEVRIPSSQRSDLGLCASRSMTPAGSSTNLRPASPATTSESLVPDISDPFVSLGSKQSLVSSSRAALKQDSLTVCHEDQVLHIADPNGLKGPVLLMETIGCMPRTKYSGSGKSSMPAALDVLDTSGVTSPSQPIDVSTSQAELPDAQTPKETNPSNTPTTRNSLSKVQLPLTPVSLAKPKLITSSYFEKENIHNSRFSTKPPLGLGAVTTRANDNTVASPIPLPLREKLALNRVLLASIDSSSSVDRGIPSGFDPAEAPSARFATSVSGQSLGGTSTGWNDPDFGSMRGRRSSTKAFVRKRPSTLNVDIPSPPPIIQDDPDQSGSLSGAESTSHDTDLEAGDAALERQRQGVGFDTHTLPEEVVSVNSTSRSGTMKGWVRMLGSALTNSWKVSKSGKTDTQLREQ
ncbi:hypothetical protein EW146_g1076 [Bondarzewia mesenterica]|uniref:Uncharacterized protein n=1 Tax=Bondarzewia mesenterica TaxID=1095465 RepID=A0A4S4M6T2_9AGAM|nr:hypothetical protein EW146_g1076 [Bondarzewia mesenterica]